MSIMTYKKFISYADEGSLVLDGPYPNNGIVIIKYTRAGVVIIGQFDPENVGVYGIRIDDLEDETIFDIVMKAITVNRDDGHV